MALQGDLIELGWKHDKTKGGRMEYSGTYRFNGRECQGKVIVIPSKGTCNNSFLTFIHDPPTELKKHHKEGCFTHQKNGWFKIHWEKPPDDVITNILYIQNILTQAMELA